MISEKKKKNGQKNSIFGPGRRPFDRSASASGPDFEITDVLSKCPTLNRTDSIFTI